MSLLRSLCFKGRCSTKIPLLRSYRRMKRETNQTGTSTSVLAKFAAHVTSASEGAVTDKDLKL